MHEMGIAMEIVDIARASIPEDMKGARIQRVNLQVGKLSAIVTDSLRFCFDMVVKDTPLEGAELAIEELDPWWHGARTARPSGPSRSRSLLVRTARAGPSTFSRAANWISSPLKSKTRIDYVVFL
jgi:hypothetical protein